MGLHSHKRFVKVLAGIIDSLGSAADCFRLGLGDNHNLALFVRNNDFLYHETGLVAEVN